MRARRIILGGAVALATAAVAHVALSATAMWFALSHDERMYQILRFRNHGPYNDIIGPYLAATVTPETVVTAGSSLTFGYPITPEATYPTSLARTTGRHVVNPSVPAAGLTLAYTDVLCELEQRGLHPAAVILEIPLINDLTYLRATPDAPFPPCGETAGRSFLAFLLENVRGLGWFTIFDDQYQGTPPSPTIRVGVVPDRYFVAAADFTEAVRQSLSARIDTLYRKALDVTRESYLFVSPVYIPGIDQAGRDGAAVRAQLEYAEAVCREVAGDRCISVLSMVDTEDYFLNLTHLNDRGGAELARLAAAAMSEDFRQ